MSTLLPTTPNQVGGLTSKPSALLALFLKLNSTKIKKEDSVLFGSHNTDHSNFKMDAGIRKAVTSEVEKRIKSGNTLCERLCDIIKNKMAAKQLKNEFNKK